MGSWRREMLKWMVLMKENQSDCHRSVRQQFKVPRNYCTRPGLSRPTMPEKTRKREGGSSHHKPVMWWGGFGRSTWTYNWSQPGFTLPSQTFMHLTGFTIWLFILILYRRGYFVTGEDELKAEDRLPAIQYFWCWKLEVKIICKCTFNWSQGCLSASLQYIFTCSIQSDQNSCVYFVHNIY